MYSYFEKKFGLPVISDSLVLSITTVADMTPLSLISDKIVEYPSAGKVFHSLDTVSGGNTFIIS